MFEILIMLLPTLFLALGLFWLARKVPLAVFFVAPVLAIVMMAFREQQHSLRFLVLADALLWAWGLFCILYQREHNKSGIKMRNFARGNLWVVGFLYSLSVGGLAATMGIIFPLLYLATYFKYRRRRIEAHTAVFLATMRACFVQQLPLAPALRSAAADEADDTLLHVFGALADHLEQGHSLQTSIEKAWPSCPGHLRATLFAGERTQQLPAAVERLYTDLLRTFQQQQYKSSFQGNYLMIVFITILLLLLVSSAWILPTLRKMFENFGGQLPAITQFVLELFTFFQRHTGICVTVVLVFFVLWALVWQTPHFLRRTWRGPLQAAIDGLRWWTPGWGWFERDMSMLHTIEVLRFGLRAGCPLPELLACAKELDVNVAFLGRLEQWKKLINQGVKTEDAIRKAGLGESLAWAFTGEGQHTEDSLEALEAHYRGNLYHRQELLRSLTTPVLQLGMGLVVGVVLLALMVPLFTMAGAVGI